MKRTLAPSGRIPINQCPKEHQDGYFTAHWEVFVSTGTGFEQTELDIPFGSTGDTRGPTHGGQFYEERHSDDGIQHRYRIFAGGREVAQVTRQRTGTNLSDPVVR